MSEKIIIGDLTGMVEDEPQPGKSFIFSYSQTGSITRRYRTDDHSQIYSSNIKRVEIPTTRAL